MATLWDASAIKNPCAFCPLCALLGADFAAGVGHCARAGAPWVGFSGIEMPRDRALADMSSPMV